MFFNRTMIFLIVPFFLTEKQNNQHKLIYIELVHIDKSLEIAIESEHYNITKYSKKYEFSISNYKLRVPTLHYF